MKQLKPLIIAASLIVFVAFLVPTILVLPFSSNKANGKLSHQLKPNKSTSAAPSIEVSVYRSLSKKTEKLPLEDYVTGVVASEMPAEFEKEALKAQALAARTYIVNQLYFGGRSDLPGGAVVTDTQNDQAYHNKEELKKIWKSAYQKKIKKIEDAVHNTAGLIITYKDKPISASFFSTSNGYTENSEDYWGQKVPYLRSVKSPWDQSSPKFKGQSVFTVAQFQAKLGVQISSNGIGLITSRTPGNRVGTVEIGGKQFTGRQVREKLDLRSSDFSWVRKGDQIIITTKGFGHGVGMSQYGANGMAKEGKKYSDIVKYYYKGVSITNYTKILKKGTSKKL